MNLTSFVPGLEFQFTFALGFAICSTRVRFFDLIHQKNSAQQVQTHLELHKSGKVTQVTKLTQLARAARVALQALICIVHKWVFNSETAHLHFKWRHKFLSFVAGA